MKRRASADRGMLGTVLFTDIVGSTELSARLEDRRWRDPLRDIRYSFADS
jgi:class 3 adenylate cyclase